MKHIVCVSCPPDHVWLRLVCFSQLLLPRWSMHVFCDRCAVGSHCETGPRLAWITDIVFDGPWGSPDLK